MPELPEVETIVRELNDHELIGKEICEVQVFWPKTVAGLSIADFIARITQQAILNIARRGKFIVISLSRDVLLIHLRMTGKLSFSTQKKEISSHERVRLKLSDGRFIHYEDQRKFGRWYLLSDSEEAFAKLGIEPLSPHFTSSTFTQLLSKSSQQIKPFLLNQKYIAGLGNIYVDEALWEAKIHPLRKANSLNATEIKHLHKAIINVLTIGITHKGTSLGTKLSNYYSVSGRRGGNQTQLKVFRRNGLSCPRCQTLIIKITVCQRGTHLCPSCQKI